jgi:predicted DNA binding protein
MATIVQGTIPVDEFALRDALTTLSGVEVEAERLVESGENVMPLLWARGADQDSILPAFEADTSVQDLSLLATFDDEQLYQMHWITEIELLIQMLAQAEATVLDAYGGGGRENWHLRVLYPTRAAVNRTQQFCETEGLTFEIETMRELRGEPVGRFGLTSRQYVALRRAVEAGYYDVPREAYLQEIAEALDISGAALSQRLRRGTKALAEDALLIGMHPTSEPPR